MKKAVCPSEMHPPAGPVITQQSNLNPHKLENLRHKAVEFQHGIFYLESPESSHAHIYTQVSAKRSVESDEHTILCELAQPAACSAHSLTMKMGAVRLSKTMVNF